MAIETYVAVLSKYRVEAVADAAMAFLDGLVERRDREYRPGVELWAIQARKHDELLQRCTAIPLEQWRVYLERFKASGDWPAVLGPSPSTGKCLAPSELLDEFGIGPPARGPALAGKI